LRQASRGSIVGLGEKRRKAHYEEEIVHEGTENCQPTIANLCGFRKRSFALGNPHSAIPNWLHQSPTRLVFFVVCYFLVFFVVKFPAKHYLGFPRSSSRNEKTLSLIGMSISMLIYSNVVLCPGLASLTIFMTAGIRFEPNFLTSV